MRPRLKDFIYRGRSTTSVPSNPGNMEVAEDSCTHIQRDEGPSADWCCEAGAQERSRQKGCLGRNTNRWSRGHGSKQRRRKMNKNPILQLHLALSCAMKSYKRGSARSRTKHGTATMKTMCSNFNKEASEMRARPRAATMRPPDKSNSFLRLGRSWPVQLRLVWELCLVVGVLLSCFSCLVVIVFLLPTCSPPPFALAMRYMSLQNCSRFLLDEDLASMRASLQYLFEKIHRFRLVNDYYLPGKLGINDLYREGASQGVIFANFDEWRFRHLFDTNFTDVNLLFNLDLRSHFVPIRSLLTQFTHTRPIGRFGKAEKEDALKSLTTYDATTANPDPETNPKLYMNSFYPAATSHFAHGEEEILLHAYEKNHRINFKVRVGFEHHVLEKLLKIDRSGVAAEFWLRRRVHWNYLLTVYCARSRGPLWRSARFRELPEIGKDWQEEKFLRSRRQQDSGAAASGSIAPASSTSSSATSMPAGQEQSLTAAQQEEASSSPAASRAGMKTAAFALRYYTQKKFKSEVLQSDPECLYSFQLGCLPKFQDADFLTGVTEAKLEAREKRQAMTVWAPDVQGAPTGVTGSTDRYVSVTPPMTADEILQSWATQTTDSELNSREKQIQDRNQVFLHDLRAIDRHETRRVTDLLTHPDITPGFVQYMNYMVRKPPAHHWKPRANLLTGVDHPVVIQALHNQLSFCVQRRYPLLPPEAELGYLYLTKVLKTEEEALKFYYEPVVKVDDVEVVDSGAGSTSTTAAGGSTSVKQELQGAANEATVVEDPTSDSSTLDQLQFLPQLEKKKRKAKAWAKILQLLDRSAKVFEKLEAVQREYQEEDNSVVRTSSTGTITSQLLEPSEEKEILAKMRRKLFLTEKVTPSSSTVTGLSREGGEQVEKMASAAAATPYARRQRQLHFERVRQSEFRRIRGVPDEFWMSPEQLETLHDVPLLFALPIYDYVISNSLRLFGTFVENELQFLTGLSIPGDIFVDVGANQGAYAIPMAKWLSLGGIPSWHKVKRTTPSVFRDDDGKLRKKWWGKEFFDKEASKSGGDEDYTPLKDAQAAKRNAARDEEEQPAQKSTGFVDKGKGKGDRREMIEMKQLPSAVPAAHGTIIPEETLAAQVTAAATTTMVDGILAPVQYEPGHVYAFEPFRTLYQKLCGNAAINGIENLHAFNFGLSDRENPNKFLYNIPGPDMRRLNYHQMYVTEHLQRKHEDAFRAHHIQPKIELQALDELYFRKECLPEVSLLTEHAWSVPPPRHRTTTQGAGGQEEHLRRHQATTKRDFSSCPNRKHLEKLYYPEDLQGKINPVVPHPPFSSLPESEIPFNDFFRINRVDLMKVDIEGQFEAYFYGAWFTLEYWRPTLVFENDDPNGNIPTILEKDLSYECVPLPATLNDDLVCVVIL
ncbi:unnamed protein product [Amoebophrya sp. A120]|nr:unnamed protein product [Amoebophrya sp. A120]|eukprot:GSA120T00013924001.1